jgi:hypothetical protein
MTRSRILRVTALATLLVLQVAVVGAADGGDGRRGASLRVVEGRIAWIGERTAEGDLPVVAVGLAGEREFHMLLLAPRTSLEEVGVSMEVGDDVRARIFEPDDLGFSRVQKILNRSSGEMARLRTMSREPLWDGAGRWQGARAGGHDGGEGNRRRDGSGDGRPYRGGR